MNISPIVSDKKSENSLLVDVSNPDWLSKIKAVSSLKYPLEK